MGWEKTVLNGVSVIGLIVICVVISLVFAVQTGVIDQTYEPDVNGPTNTSGVPEVSASNYSSVDGEELEMAIYHEVNERRADAGKERLVHSERVRLIARLHSKDMADRSFYDHTNPEGLGSPGRHDKYDGCEITNENLYLWEPLPTNDTEQIAENVVNGWANSTGHNTTQMSEYSIVTGVGVYITKNSTLYVTQNFCREHPNA
ncbi:MAG: hypothetical protein ACI80F_000174 [Natronomonas sp.]|jgi:uncharacterized protein YkwD|uniref:CAP domain-containing protein n=1 Tax=Natronomonas sp. TaxID=2184060 RepID=UPI0039898281